MDQIPNDDDTILSLKENIESLNRMYKDVLKEMDELIRRKWVVTEHFNIPLEDIVYEYENNYDEAKIKYGRIRDDIVMKKREQAKRDREYEELNSLLKYFGYKIDECNVKIEEQLKLEKIEELAKKYRVLGVTELSIEARKMNEKILFDQCKKNEELCNSWKVELEAMLKVLIENDIEVIGKPGDPNIMFYFKDGKRLKRTKNI